jgi:two-component system, chemotaxis family, protein-glutamate methylesterase/glutaminase
MRGLRRDIVVIGASAGGIEALMGIIARLPHGLPAALFVVVHLPSEASSSLAQILDRVGTLPERTAQDKTPIAHGHIYVASPDRHLLLTPDEVRVVSGPRENRHRPASIPFSARLLSALNVASSASS